tara:strand:+ start:98 stop:307 length:210 start_codon:yes stop_codon:yes gene_type:complete
MVSGQSCVEPIVIATSEPKQLYVQILLKPDVYSLLKKQVTAEFATRVGYTIDIAKTINAINSLKSFFIF